MPSKIPLKISIVLALVTLGSFGCANIAFAQADSSALILSLQKQILQLLTQIQTLQKEVTELKTETGIQTSPILAPSAVEGSPLTPISAEEAELPELTRSLALGSRGDDVRKLQEFLARDKEIYPEGLATGFYGPRTVEAVRRWQRKNNVEAVGTVGPKTIARFRELGQGVVRGLIQQGTPSGVIPPGLLTAPGIQRQMATTTTPTLASTTPESIATITPQPAILSSPATAPISSYTTSAASLWTAKTISRMTDGGIPVVASNNARLPADIKYLIAWVGTGGNSIQTALTDRNGDLIVTPRAIYSPGLNIWKDISLIWNGEEYGLGLAVNQTDGWKVYLVRIDSQGNFISSNLIGSGGPSSNAGPAIAWDGSNYALAWNPPSNDGVFLARYSPSTKKNTLSPTRVMKSTYGCDTAISWNGTLFGIVCNSDYLAVNSQGSVVVAPVMGPCTWGTDPVPGWAGHPSIVWDGNQFQIAFRDYWRAGTYRWYGVPVGSINADGKNAACYGNAHGVEYPVTYTSMALAPNARNGQHGLGRVWLDNNRIKFEELLPIISYPTILGEPATAVGNIVWATDTYAAVWRNDFGIQLSFWPHTPPTTMVAPPATVSTNVSLKVLSPNGGEQWYQGNTYNITWQNPLPNGFVGHENFRWNIALSRRGVESWQLGQVPITYSYFDWKNWTFAKSIPDGSDFKIQVGLANIKCQERLESGETLVNTYCGLPSYVSVPAAGTWDDSDNTFSISSTPPPTSTSSVTTTTTSPTPATLAQQTTSIDTQPPSIPTGLSAVTLTPTQINMSWATSTDNIGVAGYKIYRNNSYLISSTFTTYVDQTASPATTYSYTVSAYDAAGNVSTLSASASATTPPAPSGSLKLIYPNGGEQLIKHNTYLFRWDNPLAAGFAGQENFYWRISLTRPNGSGVSQSLPVTQSSLSWTIPNGTATTYVYLAESSDYKVGVTLDRNCFLAPSAPCPEPSSLVPNGTPTADYSDGFISVTPSPTPTATATTATTAVPVITSGPTVTRTDITSYADVVVSWTTNIPCSSVVSWGTTAMPNLDWSNTGNSATAHQVFLTTRFFNSTFNYKVKCTSSEGGVVESAVGTFTTEPEPTSSSSTTATTSTISISNLASVLESLGNLLKDLQNLLR